MRPRRSTWVASIPNIPAPEFDNMPRWVMCQSLATPSSALYWHIGATTTRFASSRPARRMGENKALVMVHHGLADRILRAEMAGLARLSGRHAAHFTRRPGSVDNTSSGGVEHAPLSDAPAWHKESSGANGCLG